MKQLLVVVTSGARPRVREALRAAVGLGLRGDAVTVLLAPAARAHVGDPRVDRALATLAQLGRTVGDIAALADQRADVVEIWT